MNPIIANSKVVIIKYCIYLFSRFAHNKVVTNKDDKINKPPIVGVPDLLICELGPSFLITSDKLLFEKLFII